MKSLGATGLEAAAKKTSKSWAHCFTWFTWSRSVPMATGNLKKRQWYNFGAIHKYINIQYRNILFSDIFKLLWFPNYGSVNNLGNLIFNLILYNFQNISMVSKRSKFSHDNV